MSLISEVSIQAILPLYYIIVSAGYACMATVVVLAVVFGRRARRNVKREKVAALPDGFSPLDIQRIFIGKTYPKRLTRALLAHWANGGYIKITPCGRFRVHIKQLKTMPDHDEDGAFFYDRGTYVRERELFILAVRKFHNKPINLFRSMFSSQEIKRIKKDFAAREDEGVYGEKHYRLKVVALFLSIAPFILMSLWFTVSYSPVYLVLLFIGAIGFFVLRFMTEIPLPFRIAWCSLWLGIPVAFFIVNTDVFDPLCVAYVAAAFLFVGPFVLIRFCDYREKNNLSEYSDIVNYRKYLLFASKEELRKCDYFAALPFIYAYHISFLVKRKFDCATPAWLTKNPD